jgi:hypothetical protein
MCVHVRTCCRRDSKKTVVGRVKINGVGWLRNLFQLEPHIRMVLQCLVSADVSYCCLKVLSQLVVEEGLEVQSLSGQVWKCRAVRCHGV